MERIGENNRTPQFLEVILYTCGQLTEGLSSTLSGLRKKALGIVLLTTLGGSALLPGCSTSQPIDNILLTRAAIIAPYEDATEAFLASSESQENLEKIHKENPIVWQSSFYIEFKDSLSGSYLGGCSGVGFSVESNNYIATAGHCFPQRGGPLPKIKLYQPHNPPSQTRTVTVLARRDYVGSDMVIFKIEPDASLFPPLLYRSENDSLEVMSVNVISFPDGGKPVAIVAAPLVDYDATLSQQYGRWVNPAAKLLRSGLISPGSSGAGVFYDGHLVGIVASLVDSARGTEAAIIEDLPNQIMQGGLP